MADEIESDGADAPPLFGAPRKRGRPPGAKNRPKVVAMPRSDAPMGDYEHADPDTIVSRQLQMLEWAQCAYRNEMRRAMEQKNPNVAGIDVVKLEKLAAAIITTINALKKSSDLAEELSKRLSPEDLLELAIKKIESQDEPTLRYAIKRLRAKLESIAVPEVKVYASATDAISALGG